MNTFQLERFANGSHYFLLPVSISKKLLKTGSKRFRCSINGHPPFACALMPKKEGGYYVHVGAQLKKELSLQTNMPFKAVFTADTSSYQTDMPEELEAVLATDSEAADCFAKLTPGAQRSMIYLVQQVRSSDKRIERALRIAEGLKQGKTSARNMLR